MKMKNIYFGLTAACAVCVLSTAIYSQSPQAGEITPGRARALVGVAFGLISVVIGGLAWARSAGYIGKGSGRAGAITGLVLGLAGLALSVVHLSTSTGGFGTGGGRAGAIVALVLSLIGIALGGLIWSRSRHQTLVNVS